MRLRGLLIMLWMVAFSLPTVAQTDYRPMLKEGKSWDWYFANTPSREAAINLTIVGDTVIDGEQCYKTSFQMTNLASGTVVQTANYATYLEKDKKVYIRTNDSWILVYDFEGGGVEACACAKAFHLAFIIKIILFKNRVSEFA